MYVEVLLSRKLTIDTAHSQHYDNAIVHWLVHFRVPQAVPLVGSTTYTQVAHASDVDELTLRRIVRYAMLENIFYEADANSIAHTPFSSILVTDPALRSVVEAETEESFPASAKLVEAYEKWSASEEPKHSAWCLANRADIPVWEFLREPEREERASHYTKLMNVEDTAHDLKYTIEGYDWKNAKGTIVDVGGATGQAAIALAKAYPELPQIIVEDIESKVEKGEASLPPALRNRVFFTAHDFFHRHPEAVISAKLFLLRLVLREYSDKYARRIVRNLLPALKHGGTLVIVDVIVPPPGSVERDEEMALRRMDVRMMQMFCGRERELEDWTDLLKSVDHKLIMRNVNQPVGSGLGVMEVVYDG
jgi:SAM-dependent methyltransferase